MISFMMEALRTFLMAAIGCAVAALAGSILWNIFMLMMLGIDWLEERSKVDD